MGTSNAAGRLVDAEWSGHAPKQSCCDSIGGISLILVVLDDNALLEERGMLGIMLVAVVGVDGMRHVSAD